MTQITMFPFEGEREESDLTKLKKQKITFFEGIALPLGRYTTEITLVALLQDGIAQKLWLPIYRSKIDRVTPANYYAPSNMSLLDSTAGQQRFSQCSKAYLLAIQQLVKQGSDILDLGVVIPTEDIYLGSQSGSQLLARAFYRIPVVAFDRPETRIATSIVVRDEREV